VEWIESGTGNQKVKIGQGIRVRTLKNKAAPPQKVAFLDFYFASGGEIPAGDYDSVKELVALAKLSGVLEQGGAYYTFGERKWRGIDSVVASVREELDLRDELEAQIRSLPTVSGL
jgi:recombination protein RecA